MTLNPELRRNLILELSLARLLAGPAVLAILFSALGASTRVIDELAYAICLLLLQIWGARRAGEAIAEEIAEGTWDGQRMSALGAWTMTWGKLLGATSFTWYLGGISLGVYAWTGLPDADSLHVPELVALGIMSQALSLGLTLMLLQKNRQSGRLSLTLAQALGVLLPWVVVWSIPAFCVGRTGYYAGSRPVDWMGLTTSCGALSTAAIVAFALWAVLGAYRLMRVELNERSLAWAWPLFSAFTILFYAGIRADADRSVGVALVLATLLAYVALFLARKDPLALSRFLRSLAARDWASITRSVPIWLGAFLVLIAAAALYRIINGETIDPGTLQPISISAALLFVARDFGLVIAMNFGRHPHRADLMAFVWLFTLDILLPMVTNRFAPSLLPLVYPIGFWSLVAAAPQALFFWWIALRRTRQGASPAAASTIA